MISVSLVSRSCDINEKMGMIICKYLVANCIKYKRFDTVLPLLHIVARVSTLRPMLSNGEMWNFITDGLATNKNLLKALFLIKRIPICKDDSLRKIWCENSRKVRKWR